MSADLNRRAVEVFKAVCDGPSDSMASAIRELTDGDTELERLVVSMVDQDQAEETEGHIAPGAGARFVEQSITMGRGEAPERIGRYRLTREIGRGGMGVVYEAEQAEPNRRVAVKVVRSEFASAEIMRRFRRESELLGRLEHPGIAQIFEAGTDESGVAFLAMEFVDGQPLDVFVRREKLRRLDLLRLFERMCDAVHHAHQKGVIHRDLKPANILIKSSGSGDSAIGLDAGSGAGDRSPASRHDDVDPQPKILDFGVARLTDTGGDTVTVHTHAGQLIGTPAYMSPEQIDADPKAVDARSDIYAIGVMLYNALSGRMPFDVAEKPLPEAVRILREAQATPLGLHDSTLRGDLETIVATAMERDPRRRYASVAALGDDLRRFRLREPITARPASVTYQLSRFAARNRGLVAGAAVGASLFMAGIVAMSFGLVSSMRSNAELDSANTELNLTNKVLEERNEQLETVSDFQATRFNDVNIQSMGAALRSEILGLAADESRDTLEKGLARINLTTAMAQTLEAALFSLDTRRIEEAFPDQPDVQSRLLLSLSRTLRTLGLYEAALEAADQAFQIRTDQFGPESMLTHRAAQQRGSALLELGRYDEAEKVFRQISSGLPAAPAVGADDDTIFAITAGGLVGSALVYQGEYDEAIDILEPRLDALRTTVGMGHEFTQSLMVALAVAYNRQGRIDEAIALEKQLVAERSASHGVDHINTILARLNLGYTQLETGNYELVEEIALSVREDAENRFGDNHPETLRALSLLSQAHVRTGRFQEAAAVQQALAERYEAVLGADHPTTIGELNNYASVLQDLGRYEQAELMYRDVIARFTRTLGPEHPDALSVTGNLAGVLDWLGESDEAGRLYRASLDGMTSVFGADHANTLNAMNSLGVHLRRNGRADEAEPIIRSVYEGRKRVLGEGHPATLNSLYNVGNVLLALDRVDEAEPYCLAAYEGYLALSPDHIGTLYSLAQLVNLRRSQGDLEEAVRLCRETVEQHKRVLGDDHPLTLGNIEILQQLTGDIPTSGIPGG